MTRGEDEEARAGAARALLERAEAANGRAFDDGFRDFARRRLVELETEELAERLERVATAGLGGLAVPGDAARDLVYTPVAPCRIVDTRVAGGSLAAGVPRDFYVAGVGHQGQGGSIDGCGVPKGPATAAVLNFVAVNPVGPGNLRAWAYSTPPVGPPNSSILNYTAGVNIANGIVVPLCDVSTTTCTFDLRVQADVSNTHLVLDVVGYFHRFAVERVRSFAVVVRNDAPTPLTTVCASQAQVTIEAPTPGQVIVQVVAGFRFQHQGGARDYITYMIRTTPDECASANGGDDYRWLLGPQIPGGEHQNTASFLHAFSVPAGEHTFFLNGNKTGSPVTDDAFLEKTLVATFYPN